ncbi:MAG: nucleotidyltransferase family protein [Ignavibacteriales bacterium]
MKNFSKFIINKNSTCIEALKVLDSEDSNQTLFVVDEAEQLIGTLTDGDIRRGLIKGITLDAPVSRFSNTSFRYINGKINVKEIRRLKNEGVKLLPRLSKANKVIKVFDLTRLNSILPLHAVIMAGGRGERLRPLTDNVPKPMLPLGDKPIIEHNIDRLISYGIEKITISVRYLANQIMDYFGDGSEKGIKIDYVQETEPLGTIGCLSLLDDIKYEDILVLNSDLFTNIDFEDFYLSFVESKADMAVASIPYSIDIPYAIMELNENSITSFKEKPKNTYYANAGIYLLKKECVNLIPKNGFYNSTDLMDYILHNSGKLIHSPITGYWIDIGQFDDYNKALEIVKHLK